MRRERDEAEHARVHVCGGYTHGAAQVCARGTFARPDG